MPSFYVTNASLAARTLTAGNVGLVGPSGMAFANAAAAVTMSGNALLSVQGVVAYYGDILDTPAVQVTGAARIVVAQGGMVIGPYAAIGGLTNETLHIDNAGHISGQTAVNFIAGSVNLINSGTINGSASAAININSMGFSRLINRGDISGAEFGVLVDSSAGWVRLENSGTISGSIMAVQATESNDVILNRGLIEGVIQLGAGDDWFDGKRGMSGEVHGQLGNDTLEGGAEDDRFFGGLGNDVLRGRAGDDYLSGNEGADLILGGAGDDVILGDEGNDSLSGGAGDDFIFGGAGADLIIGGAGDDTLNGGGGRDTFLFRAGHGNDLITAFQNNFDLLDLRGFGLTVSSLKESYAVSDNLGVLINLQALGGGTILVEGLSYAQLDAADLIL